MLFVVGFLLLLIVPASAQDGTLSWVHDLNALAKKMSKKPNKEAKRLVKKARAASVNPNVCAAAKMRVEDAHGSLGFKDQERDDNRYPELLVFVSFSMPDETLKSLAHQAQKKGGKIIFRGLINGSFKEMGQKLRDLGVEALIDPTLFQKHNIVRVPTFVRQGDKLTGNVSVMYALKKFEGGA